MKKTISINIAGVVFNIEEDAYGKLSLYLDSIKKYFSTYEGAEEISADIEGRIAEKFLKKLKDDNKQLLNLEDVDQLTASMGTVADFEAVEEEEDLKRIDNGIQPLTTEIPKSESTTENTQQSGTQSNKFVRDSSRKALGGVCSGLAHYFKIDVIWVRLITIVIGLFPIFFNNEADELIGLTILAYLALWAAFPEKALEENKSIKKFYRDTENKALFGVASGLASYFNIDRSLMRLLFFCSIFLGGAGLIAYFILWAVSPSANTLTQKMEMKGQAVTISNIEQNVKKNNLVEHQSVTQENFFTKIALLPFRIIGAVFSFIGKIFRGLGPVVRVFAGLLLLLIAGLVLVGFIVAFSVMIGVSSFPNVEFFGVPAEFFSGDISPLLLIFGFLALALPFLMIGAAGLGLISNRRVISGENWGIILGTWGASLGVSAALAGSYATNFSKEGSIETIKDFNIPSKTIVLDIKEEDRNNRFKNEVHIHIEGQNGSTLQAIIKKEAQGKTIKEAESNANLILYNVIQKDSLIIFDEDLSFDDKAKFRAQRANVTLKIPYNKPFIMTSAFANSLSNGKAWRLTEVYDVHPDDDRKSSDWEKVIWVVKPDSGIVALNLARHEEKDNDSDDKISKYDLDESEIDEELTKLNVGNFSKKATSDFNSIDIAGDFIIKIEEGSTFDVKMASRDLDNIIIEKEGNELRISQKSNDSPVGKIIIRMPKLMQYEASGHVIGLIKGFKTEELKIDLSGKSDLKVDAEPEKLNTKLSGNSNLYLWGKCKNIVADLAGNSYLEGLHFESENVQINASGNSNAKLNVTTKLKANTSGESSVTYMKQDNLKVDADDNVSPIE